VDISTAVFHIPVMAKDRDISKFLSYVLRHAPQEIGLTLDAGGWTPVADLLDRAPISLTRTRLEQVVAASDKQRFALSPDGTRIRANQGHSIPVDLGLTPLSPPETLYHGTYPGALDAILAKGLRPMSRHHVHLSPDIQTAKKVGARRGKPVILAVAAGKMADAGALFYRSENGVWLVDHVPPAQLARLDD